MPNWNDLLAELSANPTPTALDDMRRRYILEASKQSGRNVIAYYSSFLQKPGIEHESINDNDKQGFMNAIYGMDRSKGLDLILHTPGGDIAATESLVEYLKLMFGDDIRAIVPQIAMSAGTMIACACKSIVMGKHSNLGPIDPQFRGLPASGVVEEFERAILEVSAYPERAPVWQEIIKKYHPTFIGECEKAIEWSKSIVTKWLTENMFKDDIRSDDKVKKIVDYLSDHSETLSHSRHIGIVDCEKVGLTIEKLEEKQEYQDAILSMHHAYNITFSQTASIKIIENHLGRASIINNAKLT